MTGLPNLRWRQTVRSAFPQFEATGSDPEADFLSYVEQLRAAEEQRIELLPADAPELKLPNLTLLLVSVARLTYGDLDAIDGVLRNAPAPRVSALMLVESVDALLPLPGSLDARSDPRATLAWINENREWLVWVPEEGRFRLREV